MLNAISVVLEGGDAAGACRAAGSMARQGFLSAPHFGWPNGALDAWIHPSQQGTENGMVETRFGRACCVGPLWYRGRFGSAALERLIEEVAATGRVDEGALRGNFALFLRTSNHCLLLNDVLGFVRIYVSPDKCFYSTSWLATCAYVGRVDLDEAAAAEYVLLGASHSNDTVARGVTILPLAHAFDLARRSLRLRLSPDTWNEAPTPASFEAAAEAICAHLNAASQEIVMAFPGRTRAALSGGFDSRLIVASLLACGGRPELFVYGSECADDVSIARALAKSVGLPIEVVDKGVLERKVPDFDLARLVQNALFFDGLPNDGIYDRGSDEETRLGQTAKGFIALNGGGGEIFRNYFHLPDRRLYVADVVQTFYRGFDPMVFRRARGLAAYRERLAASMEHTLGPGVVVPRQRLTRKQVELLYPLFRCHYWMAVNNSVAVRHGYYATPLVDLSTVRLACSLPLAWKNAGRLESHLIAELHPVLASLPSSHGFRFGDGPGWQARFSEWATCRRPVSLRPLINGMHRRLRRLSVASDIIMLCRTLLPGEWRLDPILDLDRLPDDAAFARSLAVEVAWRELVS